MEGEAVIEAAHDGWMPLLRSLRRSSVFVLQCSLSNTTSSNRSHRICDGMHSDVRHCLTQSGQAVGPLQRLKYNNWFSHVVADLRPAEQIRDKYAELQNELHITQVGVLKQVCLAPTAPG